LKLFIALANFVPNGFKLLLLELQFRVSINSSTNAFISYSSLGITLQVFINSIQASVHQIISVNESIVNGAILFHTQNNSLHFSGKILNRFLEELTRFEPFITAHQTSHMYVLLSSQVLS
jgi:hypothetical protein